MASNGVVYDEYYSVHFPSATLTVPMGTSRLAAGASENPAAQSHAEYESMRELEGMLADKAFARNRMCPDPFPQFARDELIAKLDVLYRNFGLAAGNHASVELVRRFETRIAEQAKRVQF